MMSVIFSHRILLQSPLDPAIVKVKRSETERFTLLFKQYGRLDYCDIMIAIDIPVPGIMSLQKSVSFDSIWLHCDVGHCNITI